MDQDFHYYGTFVAAKTAKVDASTASRIALAANFVDFLSEARTRGYWQLMRNGRCVGKFDSPRYTFQANLSGAGASPAPGLWQSYHFVPGNYSDQDIRYGKVKFDVSHRGWFKTKSDRKELPVHHTRPVDGNLQSKQLLTRPLSAASRAMVMDSAGIWADDRWAEDILMCAPAPRYLLPRDEAARKAILTRFKEMIVGVRAHVIADTWAHQDWAGVADKNLNTYWDITGKKTARPGGQDVLVSTGKGQPLQVTHLSGGARNNLTGAPAFATLGHGWMGHLPDVSWIEYEYRPAWVSNKTGLIHRNNRQTFTLAFYDLVNYFQKVFGKSNNEPNNVTIKKVYDVISDQMNLNTGHYFPIHSERAWLKSGLCADAPGIDLAGAGDREPGPKAEMRGKYKQGKGTSLTAYGTYYLEMENPGGVYHDIVPDLYLFQIAADYHHIFMTTWLKGNKISNFQESNWATAQCVVDMDAMEDIVLDRFLEIEDA